MKNDGTAAQLDFEERMASFGKDVVIHRITDTKEVSAMRAARTGRRFSESMVTTKAQPADYFVVQKHIGGYYAEVKSTEKDRFAFSMLRPEQWSMGVRASVAHEAAYFVFVRHEPTERWWRIPFRYIREWDAQKKKSVSFQDLSNAGLQWRV